MNKEEKKEENIEPGIYKHYKDKLYKVLFIALDSETKEEKVVYQAMCGDENIWVRSKAMFLEEVEVDGNKVPRFQFVEENKHDWEGKYLRAIADYQNLLKQTAREKEEFGQFARERFLQEILPVYDNLKISLQHIDEEASKSSWLEGIKHIVNQFKGVLTDLGVTEIKTVGEKFDHSSMHAVENKETADKKKDGTVARELQSGYKLSGKVIREARVVVYKTK